MHSPELLNKLRSHIPVAAGDLAVEMLRKEGCEIRFSSSRSSKLGDFLAGRGRKKSIISVNVDLEPRVFLITFIHELAHAQVNSSIRFKRIAPHGKEWKAAYREMLKPFLEEEIFGDVLGDVVRHWHKAPATWTMKDPLYQLLPRREAPGFDKKLVELGVNMRFTTPNGRRFESLQKRRVRFLCKDLDNGKQYLVHGETPVQELA